MKLQPYQKWSTIAFGLAGLCMAALAISILLGFSSPQLSRVLMAGIFISGTAAWIIQARQKCRHCGKPYGYGVRIVNSHRCRKCGGDYRD